ncbi:outer membrane receptor protein involved in Fe transport [Pseudoduganella flava]|uniref:Outer membrane receptor protein involved in Fe transport n=1 Tax=Pseudoduganella flava TaxID=871742 RepID=A0A562PTZ5_9BURK|nr:TonB-dependent receptor plug domain-containing protein [Pseudoduganella flava]QGZ39147.1 TonB-dependent receptor plug domain-containing protein [Pseudoduganella flava]TWI47566.1 outer membrane receptor protein involved in Fe transport [Pseudoduganella flava]
MKKQIKAAMLASLALTPLAMAQQVASAVAAMESGAVAVAAPADASGDAAAAGAMATVEIATRRTRSSVALKQDEIQKILPGTNPLKALQTLPGVSFQTADPWGNNEQNLSLFVHGFSGQQLGYTMDGVPLGDQQYGNYNGLSPQRAVISENVRGVVLSSGAGDLATASTSNLGGTIETFSADPLAERNLAVQQTVGSHNTSRTFVRYDTGKMSGQFGDSSLYVSALHHEAHAWDFEGRQGGNQVNAKFVNDNATGRLTVYFNYSDKIEPNEDSTVHSATEKYQPYTRPFLFPDFQSALAYLSPTGATPAAEGNNYRNYYSDAQREDYLGYVKYDWNLSDSTTWSNQLYYHYDDGVGVVAGPIGVAGLPGLFAVYYPNQNLKQVFGNSGYATRTTEYRINRKGALSTLRTEIGNHTLQGGLWFEHNESSAYRRWYALDVNNPSAPYDRPENPLITQYGSAIDNKVVQLHLQDEWRVRPDLVVQGGFKSSLQFAHGDFPVQPKLGAIAGGSTALPVGDIDTKKWFLPQLGARWDITREDQAFVNVQKNMRHFVTYGGGGASPWSLASQSAFDLFKSTARPETSVTFEAGLRTSRTLNAGALTGFDGQVNVYHVNFKDRLLQISPTPVISAIIGGNPVLANVGNVKTDGVDMSGTLHFGRTFSFYDAISYNRSKYDDNYLNGATTVQTAGKKVPGSPEWMNKFVATLNLAGTEFQLMGDYVGKRYATYTNDLSVKSYFLLGLGVSGKLPFLDGGFVKNARYRVNVTNLADRRGDLNVVVGAADKTYNTFPIAPRQGFLTLMADFK